MTFIHVPLVNQNTPITADGLKSENGSFDCVATSILAVIMYLKGIPQVDHDYNPDRVLNLAYPEGYHGGTSASVYVDAIRKTFNMNLHPIETSNMAETVKAIHNLLAQGKPVVLTQIDPYASASLGWTHVVVACGDDTPGHITIMDPFIAKYLTYSDEDWQQRLRSTELWIIEEVDDMAITINSPHVSDFFEEIDAHTWHCRQTGKNIVYGMLAMYKATSGLETLGLPQTGEIAIETIGKEAGYPFAHLAGHHITVQAFERGNLIYDPSHLVDRTVAGTDVYRLKLYDNGAGTDNRLWILQSQISQLTAQLQAEHAGIDPAKVQTRLAQIALEAEQIAATAKAPL